MARKFADTNPFGGQSSSNPYATNAPAPQGAGGSPPDAQSTNSMDADTGIGGGDLPMATPDATTQQNQGQVPTTTASLYLVACLTCGQEGALEKVSASLKCKCGSDNVVYDKVDSTPGSDPGLDGSENITFSSGIIGFVYPIGDGNWHWTLLQNHHPLRHGIAYSKDQAKRITERLAPEYAKPITEAVKKTACHVVKNGDSYDVIAGGKNRGTHKSREDAEAQREAIESSEHSAAKIGTWQKVAEFPPPKKKDDSGDDKDKKDDSSGDDKAGSPPASAPASPPVGQPVPPAAPGAPAAPGQTPPAQAPVPGQPAAGPAQGADPQNPQAPTAPVDPNAAGQAPATTGGDLPDTPAPDPNADPNAAVDPNAAQVDPNAANPAQGPVGTDPMDIAQGTLENVVDQANALGHDAKETAYDVDKLFSEWRCMNCFAGETLVKTRHGDRPIEALAGGTHELLTDDGEWIKAPVQSFGRQPVYEVRLGRAGATKTIRATGDHRWLLESRHGVKSEASTTELLSGSRLQSTFPSRNTDLGLDPRAVARGFVYGDGGSYRGRQSYAIFCGPKDEALLPYFEGVGSSVRNYPNLDNQKRINGLPIEWKTERPSLDSPDEIYGWLAGYFAADGSVSETGGVTISSASLDDLEFYRLACQVIGIGTYNIGTHMRLGFGSIPSALHKVGLIRDDLEGAFFIIPEHRIRFETNILSVGKRASVRKWRVLGVRETGEWTEVYCAVVPGTRSFSLADNILTGNCDQEGRADIGEDGQVAFSGDLLDGPQGCAAPQVGLPDQSGMDAAAPVPDGGGAQGLEVGQQDIPAATAKKHKFWRNPFKREANDETQNDLNSNRPNLNQDNQPESQDYEEAIKGEKIATLTEAILESNPGMNDVMASRIARDTFNKYPSIVG